MTLDEVRRANGFRVRFRASDDGDRATGEPRGPVYEQTGRIVEVRFRGFGDKPAVVIEFEDWKPGPDLETEIRRVHWVRPEDVLEVLP